MSDAYLPTRPRAEPDARVWGVDGTLGLVSHSQQLQ